MSTVDAAGTVPAAVDAGQPQWGLPRGVIVLLGGAGLVASVAGLKAIAGIAAPVLLAFMIVIGVAPLTAILDRRGWPGWLQTVITVLVSLGILVGIGVLLAYAGVKLASVIPEYSSQWEDLEQDVQNWLASIGVSQEQIQAALKSIDIADVSGFITEVASSILGVLGNFGFIMLMLAFIGLDLVAFRSRLAVSKYLRPGIGTALDSFVGGTRNYLIVSTVFGAIVGAIDAIALAVIGIPYAALWGVISFITNYIPNIGFVLGVIPPALIALLQGGWSQMLLVIALYSVINFVIQSLIQPKVMGDSVSLATTVTFLSLTVWAWILGPLGALLAIPLTLLTKALLIDIDPSTRWIGILLKAGKATPEDLALLQDSPGEASRTAPLVAPEPA